MGRVIALRRPRSTLDRLDLLIALIAGVTVFLAVLMLKPPQEATAASAPLPGLAGPARVVDGDTLDVATTDGIVRVRLNGIDALEAGQTCDDGSACGRAAKAALTERLRDRPVSCSVEGQDRYGRTLARCRARGEDIGGWMVESGHAVAYRRYSHAYVSHELKAREMGAGAWAAGFQTPEAWRHAR